MSNKEYVNDIVALSLAINTLRKVRVEEGGFDFTIKRLTAMKDVLSDKLTHNEDSSNEQEHDCCSLQKDEQECEDAG